MKKAVFLDRDGVINKTLLKMGKQRAPYTMNEFAFIEGVAAATKMLHAHGFILIVVTNQPDVARGWVTREAVDLVNEHVLKELGVDDVVSCFHTEKDSCQCRKPKPGMLIESAMKWDIDLSQSFMVGDRMSDVEAGKSAGCKTILLGEGEADVSTVTPDHRALDLSAAIDYIMG